MKDFLISIGFDQIRAKLASYTHSQKALELALNLVPSSNIESANKVLDETNEAYNLLFRLSNISLNPIHKIDDSVKRASQDGTLSQKECANLLKTFKTAKNLFSLYENTEGIEKLSLYFKKLSLPNDLISQFHNCFLDEDEIQDSASENLHAIRRAIKRKENEIRDSLSRFISSENNSTYLSEKIVTIKQNRFCVPIKKEAASKVSGICLSSSASEQTLYIQPASVVSLNNELEILLQDEKSEINKILCNLTSLVKLHSEEIKTCYYGLYYLDFTFAKATLAMKQKAKFPVLNVTKEIKLNGLFHPLIDEKKVVKNDICASESEKAIIITGPNTGGKTATILAISLSCVMAASGLFILANEDCTVPFFQKFYSVLGDEQSIEESLSTFSAQMKKLIFILNEADENSLVLLDELCIGTDPNEAEALGVVILEKLIEKNVFVLCTSHYSLIKQFSLTHKNVKPLRCEFDEEKLAPTYRILSGIGPSEAFNISQKLGLDENLVQKAKCMLSESNLHMNEVLKELEVKRLESERDRQIAHDLVIDAENKVKKAQTDAKRLVSSALHEAEVIKRKASDMIEKLHTEYEDTLRLINAFSKMKSMSPEERANMNKKFAQLESDVKLEFHSESEIDESYKELCVGDFAYSEKLDSLCKIEKIDGKNARISAGNVKATVALETLRKPNSEEKKKAKKEQKSNVTKIIRNYKNTKGSVTELDLRGQTCDDALLELDRFLDNAYRSHLSQVTIIHGKGTGALRSAVTNSLKLNKFVKSSRLGTFGEGEDGVTIVSL